MTHEVVSHIVNIITTTTIIIIIIIISLFRKHKTREKDGSDDM